MKPVKHTGFMASSILFRQDIHVKNKKANRKSKWNKTPLTLTWLCYICSSREEVWAWEQVCPSLLGRLHGAELPFLGEYEWLLSQEQNGLLLFWREVCFQKGIILSFFHLMVLIHYCTVCIIVMSTAIWIKSCYIRNRKHPSCDLKGWNDVTP